MRVSRPTKNVLEVRTPIEGEEIHLRKVTKFSNGAKIDFIKKFIGKKVLIVIMKDDR